jgi:hypothetical protein
LIAAVCQPVGSPEQAAAREADPDRERFIH